MVGGNGFGLGICVVSEVGWVGWVGFMVLGIVLLGLKGKCERGRLMKWWGYDGDGLVFEKECGVGFSFVVF